MEKRDLVGMEARTSDGTEVGRIAETILDEESGEITRVLIEREGERFEIPLSSISFDEEADQAIFDAGGTGEETAGYSPAEPPESVFPEQDDREREGQLVSESGDKTDEVDEAEAVREDWQDLEDEPDSGYPRTDAYIDPDTGEGHRDPALTDEAGTRDEVAALLEGTDLRVTSESEGVIVLSGTVSSQSDLEELLQDVMELDDVLEVDATDVDAG